MVLEGRSSLVSYLLFLRGTGFCLLLLVAYCLSFLSGINWVCGLAGPDGIGAFLFYCCEDFLVRLSLESLSYFSFEKVR